MAHLLLPDAMAVIKGRKGVGQNYYPLSQNKERERRLKTQGRKGKSNGYKPKKKPRVIKSIISNLSSTRERGKKKEKK